MHSSRFLIGLISLVSVALVTTTDVHAAKKKDEFADTRVCVKLGVETNHPFEKVCTRKVAVVEAAKWSTEDDSVHFVFLRNGAAYTAGHIKYKMDGGVSLERGELNFCVMEVPAFRGTEEQSIQHNSDVVLSYYYAARDSGNDFTGVKTTKFAPRDKDGMFPDDCDLVAATGTSWKKAWTKVVEQISLNSGPNSKFGQEFKQSFTDSLGELALAFSLTPEQVVQGQATARNQLKKLEQEKQESLVAYEQMIESGSEAGLLFVRFEGSAPTLCHHHAEPESINELLRPPSLAASQVGEWEISKALHFDSLEDVFAGTLAGKCGAAIASPGDIGRLQDALAKRSVSTELGSTLISDQMVADALALVTAAKKEKDEQLRARQEQERKAAAAAEARAREKEEQARLAAAQRAEEERVAEQAKEQAVAAKEAERRRASQLPRTKYTVPASELIYAKILPGATDMTPVQWSIQLEGEKVTVTGAVPSGIDNGSGVTVLQLENYFVCSIWDKGERAKAAGVKSNKSYDFVGKFIEYDGNFYRFDSCILEQAS